ncbi:MAG: class I SAM-dependent methyltransferase [Candidatus Curtissbacteria bacterium]|nr:class I SAM-dependent methyltransferase [Candidatus Curtissbacteria bacterium]
MLDAKLTNEEQQTLNSYNKYGKQWAASHSDFDFWAQELNRFKKFLPQGKVLEIGSGGGRDAREIIKAGYDYSGTDISKGLLEAAKKYNPGAKFLLKSVYNLNFPKNSFDGFWACAVLLHVPKKRIDEALQQLHRVIKSHGVGFISVKKGKGEKNTVEPPPDGQRFFAYYSLKEFAGVLLRNDFEVLYSKERKKTAKTTWLIYFVSPNKD